MISVIGKGTGLELEIGILTAGKTLICGALPRFPKLKVCKPLLLYNPVIPLLET